MSSSSDDQLQCWHIVEGGFQGQIILSRPHESVLEFVKPRRGVVLLEVKDLYVHPLRRGYGWGAELMRKACTHADRTGADMVLRAAPHGRKRTRNGRRLPFKHFDELKAFYRSFGFRQVAVRNHEKITYDLPHDGVMVRRHGR